MDWIFSDLLESGILDLTNDCQRDAVVFFADILQKDSDKAREHWNSYKIRRSHHTTIQGVPDILYFLPEQAGEGRDDCLVNVPLRTLEEVKQEIIVGLSTEDQTEFWEEYFHYVMGNNRLFHPTSIKLGNCFRHWLILLVGHLKFAWLHSFVLPFVFPYAYAASVNQA